MTRLKPAKNHSANVLNESEVIFFLNLALARRRMETEEVLHGGKVRGLHVLSENPFPYSGFVRNGQSFLEGILLRLFIVPAKIPRQYSSSQGWRQSPLTGHNDPTLHLNPA